MSIRSKLKLAFLAMITIPQIILIIAATLLTPIFSDKFDSIQKYKVHWEMEQEQLLLQGELKAIAAYSTEKLEDPEFRQQLLERINKLNSGVAVCRGEQISFSSVAPTDNPSNLCSQQSGELESNGRNYYAYRLDFQYVNGDQGTIITYWNYKDIPVYLRPLMILAVLGAVAATMLVLTYLVSRSILRPLNSLKQAADKIKEGQLDFHFGPMSRDEVGEVAIAFEQMRNRLKASLEESAQYEHNRRVLISNISHDLKTPITAVKGYVEGMMDGVANTEEKRQKYMLTIYRKASEMDRLIDELFLFSKLDMKQEPFEFTRIGLNSFVADYMEEQRFELDKSGIRLEVRCEGEAGELEVQADHEKLSRVFSNIIGNSKKYMQVGSTDGKLIVVTVSRDGDDALVQIADTGPGVDEYALPYLFDRFYRAEQSRNSELGGSGLGLAIVRQIIEGHGGMVWATNKPAIPQAATGFMISFKLPLCSVERRPNYETDTHY